VPSRDDTRHLSSRRRGVSVLRPDFGKIEEGMMENDVTLGNCSHPIVYDLCISWMFVYKGIPSSLAIHNI